MILKKGGNIFSMKKSLFFVLLLFILSLFSCSTLLSEKYTAEVPTCQCLPAFPDKDGWYGGDGAYSIQLDTERILWLFGDTFVSDEEGRNDRIDMDAILGTTLAISTCSENCKFKIQYYLKKKNGKFVSSFAEEQWLWPQDPFIVGDVLFIPLIAIAPTDTEELFNFNIEGHKFARIKDFSASDPNDWPVDYIDLTLAIPTEINAFATTSVVHDDHVYFYPFYAHFSDDVNVLGNILARIPSDKLDNPVGAVEYFTNEEKWQDTLNPSKVKIVLDACVSELSVRYHAADKKWIAVYLSPQNKGNQLLFQYADKLEGPWSKPESFDVNIPEINPGSPLYNRNTFCYAGKEHIEFSGDGKSCCNLCLQFGGKF